jgi:hypothetical protein
MLAGCTTIERIQGTEISGTTTQFNNAVEKAQNEMLLLNIVRASNRQPMYFTTLNDIKASMSYGLGTGAITAPFALYNRTPLGGQTTYFSVAPTVSYANTPIYDVVLLNSKEFINGMMTPIPAETFAYYLDQRWPLGMLLYLLADSIREGGKDYINSATDKSFPQFEDTVSKMATAEAENECTLKEDDHLSYIGPDIPACEAEDLGKLVEVQKAGLKLQYVDKTQTYQLSKAATRYRLVCFTPKIYYYLGSPPPDVKGANVIHLRSPEGILYYLGELTRFQQNNRDNHIEKKPIEVISHKDKDKDKDCTSNLFDVRKRSTDASDALVTVEHEGEKYFIRRTKTDDICPKDRTMHVLSFMSLLISKQTTVPPSSIGVVTTIPK